MTRKGKWIEEVSPDAPLAEVARAALEARCEVVWRYLKLAVERPATETENIHQLRVAARRATAAARMFAELLPPRRALWMIRKLRKIRKAAGNARDLDVMFERMRELAGDEPSAPWRALMDQATARRARAQRPIVKIWKKLSRGRFKRRARTLVKRARPRSKLDRLIEPRYAASARRTLRRLTDDFFSLSDVHYGCDEALHAVRIQGKELRYAMEIFGAAFEPSFRTNLYPLMEALQTRLGRLNDHVVAQLRLRKWLARASSSEAETLEAWIQQELDGLLESRRDFLAWWTVGRREELRREFARYTREVAHAADHERGGDFG